MSRASKKLTATAAELERLIALIDDRLKDVGEPPEFRDQAAWRAHLKKYEDIVVELVAHHGAGFRAGVSDASTLSLAGIRTSCTGGNQGLLRNWQKTATRRLEKMKGAAA